MELLIETNSSRLNLNQNVERALDRLETYLGRVRALTGPEATARTIYQAMSDTAELAEIARRMYGTLGELARGSARGEPSKTPTRRFGELRMTEPTV
jgi:hypothetical protein